MATLSFTIPDQLAQDAKAMGLLDDHAIASLLSQALRQKYVESMFGCADRLSKVGQPVMNAEEIQAEIEEARSARRARRS
jgi:hypothetical protein